MPKRLPYSSLGTASTMLEGEGKSGSTHADNAVTITPYRDGPYLVRGAFAVQDQEGNELALERRTIALCRCGKSRMRPFCDGTHRLIGFKAPSGYEQWPDLDEDQSHPQNAND
jgi:CDGSH-type Zn-finger protein